MSITQRKLTLTLNEIEVIFEEWQRRDNEDDDELRVSMKDSDYAKVSADYFLELHDDIFTGPMEDA